MEALLYLLPALGCGLMMVVMMVFMGRLMALSDTNQPTTTAPGSSPRSATRATGCAATRPRKRADG